MDSSLTGWSFYFLPSVSEGLGQLRKPDRAGSVCAATRGHSTLTKTDLWPNCSGAQGSSGPTDRKEVEPGGQTPSLGLRTLEGRSISSKLSSSCAFCKCWLWLTWVPKPLENGASSHSRTGWAPRSPVGWRDQKDGGGEGSDVHRLVTGHPALPFMGSGGWQGVRVRRLNGKCHVNHASPREHRG